MATAHSHGNAPPHEHEGATPGHTHEGDTAGTGTTPVAPAGTAAAGTAAAAHSHPGTGSHTHADDSPGHSHDAPAAAAVDVRPTAGGMTTRILLTVLGAAGMIIGAFLPWAFDDKGTEIEPVVFYSTNVEAQADLLMSAGGIVILLGILALLGMALRTGWLTSLAGVLGMVAFVLVVITLYRLPAEAEAGIGSVQIGLWLVLAGGLLALLGGFFGARPRAVARTADTTARF